MLCVCDTGDGNPCVVCVCVCYTGDGHPCVMRVMCMRMNTRQ